MAEQERERTLEMLRHSERRLAAAQQVAHIGSWERDLHSNVVAWSDELYRLFGLQAHEGDISYQRFLNLVAPQDVERIRMVVDEAIRERGSFNVDYRITLPDGRGRVINDRGSVILNEKDEPVRLVGTAQDVTELRQTEQALKRQEVILQTIFDHIPVMIAFVDAASRVQMVNRHWERVLGWSLAEAQSRDLLREAYPDPEYRARVMEYTLHPTPGWTDFKVRVRDGRTLDTSWALIVLPDGTRIGIGQDITERTGAEKALRLSEERLNLAVHAADLGIFEHDHQTNTFYWSPKMRAIFADEAASLQAYFGLIPPDDRERIVAAVHQAHASISDGFYSVEHPLVRPDGGRRWVSVCSRTLFEGEGDARRPLRTVGIVADVTERKRAEKEIREFSASVQALSRRLLEVQEAERRHLARELHDEIGQSLTGLQFLLEAEPDVSARDARGKLDAARAAVAALLGRVRELSFDLRPAMLDHLGLLPALLWLFERYTAQMKVQVQFRHEGLNVRFAPETETTAYRLVQEALTNVARHAGVNEVSVRLWVQEGALHVQVEDEGIGFDLETALAAKTTSGLAGMQERVQLLGGRLTVASVRGEGTQLIAFLPLAQVREDAP
ncbi:hypothetical protein AYO44_17915 [Planctomycetaceae bacterium SCGC AG-212-F19]|nr:hypothetical protein AYO44_17915 [Planctomycetaceae bacterium SCGC AG-212-F19]